MSYQLLSSLYFGEGTNADLATPETRALLHVDTPLDQYIPTTVERGLDVVLTGNPGDGKSHVVRTLLDRGRLREAEVELDLSAKPTAEVMQRWKGAVSRRKPFVLCANEGPLLDLVRELDKDNSLQSRAQELRAQLGRLIASRTSELPQAPERVALVDLADRNVLDVALIERALQRICDHRFLPRCGTRSTETSAGRNLMIFAESSTARRRLATVLVAAGKRFDEHVSFRQLWSAIAFSLTAGKKESTLGVELSQGKVGLGTFPLDHLVKEKGRGLLIDATRVHGDPARVTDPMLDEEIWTAGRPGEGRWFFDDVPTEIPAKLWANGDRERALATHASLKRLVALAHDVGDRLLARLGTGEQTPSSYDASVLQRVVLEGIRRLYVSPSEEGAAADWLLTGLPLWIAHSYQDLDALERPHIAVVAIPEHSFQILRPVRAPWLADALGPLPDVAWLAHTASGIALRLDSDLLSRLALARNSSGPLKPPEVVQRFLSRLAGWEESKGGSALHGDQMAVLERPRGELVVTAATREVKDGEFAYV